MKILVIRFSSIGDIVLTTPVVRSLYTQIPDCEIHYLTKAGNVSLLLHNPYISRIHPLQDPFSDLIRTLKAEQFDYVIDLHKNLRSLRVKHALKVPSRSLNKENWKKYRMTRFKHPLEVDHIVKRYGDTLRALNLELDKEGLEVFIPDEYLHIAKEIFYANRLDATEQSVLAVVLGASYFTKRWITEYFAPLLNTYGSPVVLIGGKDTQEEAEQIVEELSIPYLNAVGKYDLLTSAALMKHCSEVITHDTGFMHIAAAFRLPTYSIWGNTVPEFGMTPYRSQHKIIEVKGLDCRPCSKLGFDTCPKGHFRCMKELTPDLVLEKIQSAPWRK